MPNIRLNILQKRFLLQNIYWYLNFLSIQSVYEVFALQRFIILVQTDIYHF